MNRTHPLFARGRFRAAAAGLAVVSISVAAAVGASSSVPPGARAKLHVAPSKRRVAALPSPARLAPFAGVNDPSGGTWHPAGRLVDNQPALYETTLALPDNPTSPVGIAWMDTRLLHARLYSGSLSPGGLFWKYTAPVTPSAAKTLVAAFNGGYQMKDAGGGYLSEGKMVVPLRDGAASLVIYANGSVALGAWGRDVSMSKTVVAVRQNLTLLVDGGRPAPGLSPNDTEVWGSSLHGIADQWRSGLGITANGALVYVAGVMTVVDLANVLVKAGAVRAMTLDMNPYWTVFSSYAPSSPNGEASPANGTDLLPSMYQSPARFFSAAYNRDFIAMSAA